MTNLKTEESAVLVLLDFPLGSYTGQIFVFNFKSILLADLEFNCTEDFLFLWRLFLIDFSDFNYLLKFELKLKPTSPNYWFAMCKHES